MASVLVVDDDAGIRESAVMALRKVGHRIHEAEDAESALRLLREHRFDVVVSDIYMPGEDGLTLLKAISARQNPPRVILMTARGTIETTSLANRFGAFDYLSKPFDLSELIECVAAAARTSEVTEAPAEDRGPSSRIIGTETASTPQSPPAPNELVDLDEAERRHITSVLRATAGNQTQAAFILGIERKTLARKIKRLNITIENP